MKWLKEWFLWLTTLIKRLFSRKGPEQSSVVPPYRDTGDLVAPKKLGVGSPPVSADRIIEMAEELSGVEAGIKSKLIEAKIESLHKSNSIAERKVEGEIANKQARLEFEKKQLDLKAEEMRRLQEREDDEARARVQREQFIAEQEQFRLNNEQAAAQVQEKRERKEKQAAERREWKERDKQKRSEARKAFWANRSEEFKSLWGATKPLFSQAASSKRVRQLFAALLFLLFVYGLYATEIGQTWLNQVLSIVETNQTIIIGVLLIALLGLIVYWLVKTDRWQSVQTWLSDKRKPFGVMALIAAIVGLLYILYQYDYLSSWVAQGSAWLAEIWPYRWYTLGILLLIGFIGLAFWIRRRVAVSPERNKDKAGEKAEGFFARLSVARRMLLLGALWLVAFIGAGFGQIWIVISAVGLMPLLVSQFEFGPFLVLRFGISFFIEVLAFLFLLSRLSR